LGHTFSRSYGVNLPSSFTRVLSNALVFSTCPPVSVCGTVLQSSTLRGFSWKLGINYFSYTEIYNRHRVSALTSIRICLNTLPTHLNRDFQHSASLTFSVPPSLQLSSTGILTCFPSATHLCLTLGADSPCADYRCAGNLGLPACGFFTRIIVTHVSIRTSDISSTLLNAPSQTYRTLLYRSCIRMNP
jgi:hypothetical protein